MPKLRPRPPTPKRQARICGNRIRMRRESLGMNQLELSFKAHVSQGHLSAIENGQREHVNSDTLYNLADVLQTNVDYIMDMTSDPSPRDPKGTLTEEEEAVLRLWRSLADPLTRGFALDTLRSLSLREAAARAGSTTGQDDW